ncbi:cytochrome P460 family protein [Novosphingobium sp.]|jgi:hypothetical protein|uniref:cytochrome P460 family protein n=1 Tax=Novosphingobium sp. TaxID=1874826 RepID=UPI003D6D5D62
MTLRPGACCLALAAAVLGLSTMVAAQDRQTEAAPVYGVRLPEGYRDWKLISVAHEAGKNNDIRAILGNEIALRAYRAGTRPFPDGAVIVRLAWRFESSPRNDAVFPAPQSFVAGEATNVQVSVKDARRYAASGGWGYGQFEDGKPDPDEALTRSCAACHARLDAGEPGADRVFTDYAR